MFLKKKFRLKGVPMFKKEAPHVLKERPLFLFIKKLIGYLGKKYLHANSLLKRIQSQQGPLWTKEGLVFKKYGLVLRYGPFNSKVKLVFRHTTTNVYLYSTFSSSIFRNFLFYYLRYFKARAVTIPGRLCIVWTQTL